MKQHIAGYGTLVFLALLSLLSMGGAFYYETQVRQPASIQAGWNNSAEELRQLTSALTSYYQDNQSWPDTLQTLATSGYFQGSPARCGGNGTFQSAYCTTIFGAPAGDDYSIQVNLLKADTAAAVASQIPGGSANGSTVIARIARPFQSSLYSNYLQRRMDPARSDRTRMDTSLNVNGNELKTIGSLNSEQMMVQSYHGASMTAEVLTATRIDLGRNQLTSQGNQLNLNSEQVALQGDLSVHGDLTMSGQQVNKVGITSARDGVFKRLRGKDVDVIALAEFDRTTGDHITAREGDIRHVSGVSLNDFARGRINHVAGGPENLPPSGVVNSQDGEFDLMTGSVVTYKKGNIGHISGQLLTLTDQCSKEQRPEDCRIERLTNGGRATITRLQGDTLNADVLMTHQVITDALTVTGHTTFGLDEQQKNTPVLTVINTATFTKTGDINSGVVTGGRLDGQSLVKKENAKTTQVFVEENGQLTTSDLIDISNRLDSIQITPTDKELLDVDGDVITVNGSATVNQSVKLSKTSTNKIKDIVVDHELKSNTELKTAKIITSHTSLKHATANSVKSEGLFQAEEFSGIDNTIENPINMRLATIKGTGTIPIVMADSGAFDSMKANGQFGLSNGNSSFYIDTEYSFNDDTKHDFIVSDKISVRKNYELIEEQSYQLENCLKVSMDCVPEEPMVFIDSCLGCTQEEKQGHFFVELTGNISKCRHGCGYDWTINILNKKPYPFRISRHCDSGEIESNESKEISCQISVEELDERHLANLKVILTAFSLYKNSVKASSERKVQVFNTAYPKPQVNVACAGDCNTSTEKSDFAATFTGEIWRCSYGCRYEWVVEQCSDNCTYESFSSNCPSGVLTTDEQKKIIQCNIAGVLDNQASANGKVVLLVSAADDENSENRGEISFFWKNSTLKYTWCTIMRTVTCTTDIDGTFMKLKNDGFEGSELSGECEDPESKNKFARLRSPGENYCINKHIGIVSGSQVCISSSDCMTVGTHTKK